MFIYSATDQLKVTTNEANLGSFDIAQDVSSFLVADLDIQTEGQTGPSLFTANSILQNPGFTATASSIETGNASGFDFAVTIIDGNGNPVNIDPMSAGFDADAATIAALTEAALETWGTFINGAAGATIEVELVVEALDDGTVASAGGEIFPADGLNEFVDANGNGSLDEGEIVIGQIGAALELQTGTDADADSADIFVSVNSDLLADDSFHIDEVVFDPLTGEASVNFSELIPANAIDLFSVLVHELGHGLGFLGLTSSPFEDLPTFTVPSVGDVFFGTAFDLFTNISDPNNVTFDGPATIAAYGEPVLLESTTGSAGSDLSHFAGNTPGVDTAFSLLNPFVIPGDRVSIGALELAVLSDIGFDVNIPDDLSLINVLDSLPAGAAPTFLIDETTASLSSTGLDVTVGADGLSAFTSVSSSTGVEISFNGVSQSARAQILDTSTDTVNFDLVELVDATGFVGNLNLVLDIRFFNPAQAALENGTNQQTSTLDTGIQLIAGDAGADVVTGTDGVDLFLGRGGDDNFEASGGDDTIDGGSGNDTATYEGDFGDFTITDNGDGTLTITDDNTADGDEGTDTLSNVETLVFADSTVLVSNIVEDNDDFADDITTDAVLATNGTAISGTLEIEGDNDVFAVNVVAGQSYQFDVNLGTLSDSTLTLLDGNGAQIVFDDNGGPGLASQILFTATATETLFLDVAAFADSGVGTYTLTALEIDGVFGTPGNDTITTTGFGDDLIFGLAGDDVISSGLGNDIIDAGSGNDTVVAGLDNDIVDGGAGVDNIDLGLGNDVLQIRSFFDIGIGSVADGGLGTDTIQLIGFDFFATDVFDLEFENISDNGTVIADIRNFENYDSTASTSFGETVFGTNGNNVITTGAGTTFILAEAGNDTVDGGAGNDVIDGGSGADILNGGDGTDTLLFFGTNTAVDINLATNTVSGGNAQGDTISNFENVIGGDGNDTITGSADNNTLDGGLGADTLDGGAGADTLIGGDGNDVLTGGAQNDILDGGAGNDTLLGGLGVDNLTGGDGQDLVLGGNRDDTLDGGAGNDRTFGGNGNDTVDGGAGNDIVRGGNNDDELTGNTGDDAIFGGVGRDNISGGDGDDFIDGRGGFDVLNGGAGNDTLTGGFNADTFVFEDGFGNDTITDFAATSNPERIDFSNLTGITDFADLVDNHLSTNANGDAVITDGADTITLLDVDIADLDAIDFVF